jgi:tight adherence protein C
MNPVLLIAIGVGVFIFLLLLYFGMRDNPGRDPLQERLAQYGERQLPDSLEEIELQVSVVDRVFRPMARQVAKITIKFTPQKQLEEARRLIDLASMTLDPAIFFAMRIVVTIAFVLISFMLFFVLTNTDPRTAMLYTLGAALLGFFFPVLWIKSKISKRQRNILKALPDALDLLVICVEAGLGFDQAMAKVYEKWDNDLAIAFGRVLREIQLGKLRRDALRDMSNRMEVPDVTAFVAAIIQADQLGVSMSKILRVQSDQMRVKRRQRAQETAHQAPVKMMIPMVFLIFPSIWIVLLGPAAIILFNTNTPL